jgi:undecaprenyl-diphosphatase
MIEHLKNIDSGILLLINSFHAPWADELMWVISSREVWIPLYLILIILAFRKLGLKKTVLFVIIVIASTGLSDLISVNLIKYTVERFRPSHHGELANLLHFYEESPGDFYRGGKYGFVSSHASNFFALAFSVSLCLKKYYSWMFPFMLSIAGLVCYSRMYLGVHYPSDILGGAVLGSLIAFLMWKNWWKKNENLETLKS